ncbi:chitinase C-terminal domain-containing protein [Streptomyces clavuligerus]|uniref:Chitinase n=1 Tax=Streptomyces clavuligerus TaxID=1901 RepID=D5SL39_STRCL|nr:glycosyl hydrolase family 18 protein [Streptomyces clavuligerus]ANW22509.1 chitinase [Streptomyces clavuligerus]AXU16989.1 chitinase [Streptomyces clavuligerus]EFG04632.1 chitinase precursor [Streptomyces clavuligerus]MBY6306921.1 chitinase C-terminal domain-containing protein [Streptomyces clavuligerus]QCS10488.1 chitinase [Streptomyces clavuligerus]
MIDRATGRRRRHRLRGTLLAGVLVAEVGIVVTGGAATPAAATAPTATATATADGDRAPRRAASAAGIAASVPVSTPLYIQNVNNGGHIGVMSGNIDPGLPDVAVQAPQGDDKHQSWTLEPDGSGHRLRNTELPTQCLVHYGEAPAILGDCTGLGTVWDVQSLGGDRFRIKQPGTDRHLSTAGEISKSSKETPLAYASTDGNKEWIFTAVSWPRLPMPPEDRRTLEHMTFLTAHNSMINTEDGYDTLAPNQPHSMRRQLADGVRALMPDVNAGVVNGTIPLCHGGKCGGQIVPSNNFGSMLTTVKEFLDTNRKEIVTLFIEDVSMTDLTNDDYLRHGFDQAPGARDLLFVPDDTVVPAELKQGWNVQDNGWPLLKDMIAKNKRLLIFSGQEKRQEIGFMADQRWRVENHWQMGLGLGDADWSCFSRWGGRPLSTGTSGQTGRFKPLFVMNHFRQVPMAPTYTNDNRKLRQRAESVCTTAARRKPNFVAVDQYRDGDLFPQIQAMNEYWYRGGEGAGQEPGPGPGPQPGPGSAGDPVDTGTDHRGPKPAVSGPHSACRPDGMAATPGVTARYCDVYGTDGREWLGGNGQDRRVVGYFHSGRHGKDGKPRYLVKNIPWTKVTHINYAFARIEGDRISVGDEQSPDNPATGMTWPGVRGAEMDESLPYRGHFNQLAVYKRKHPQVKPLIAVGGWSDSKGFYAMTTNADGTVNQAGINTFADSVTAFLGRYGAAFDGVDIDHEYPTALPDSGNPDDWALANPRRKGLQAGYNALMKTLREKLDRAGAERGRYYLLTSAASASGHLVRGYDGGQALAHQDFVNVMAYDLHGSWNQFVGPQAPLYDDGKDGELAAAGVYDSAKNPEYDRTGYFNVDWAYHYYRGALQPGRINLGLPLYTRGWRDVRGGTNGLWGTAPLTDQGQCQPGTGTRTPCGNGAVGIDNVWHDTSRGREVAAGVNPLWHARNLQDGITPGYLTSYGLDPARPENRLTGTYQRHYSGELEAAWLWNPEKKVFLTTEDERSVNAKVQYVKDRGIGGVMMWELSGDYTRGADGQYVMGYDTTTRIADGLRGAGAYRGERAGATPLPGQVLDVSAEFTGYPTAEADLWPQQPKLRITNNSTRPLPSGTELSFDIPTSAPPLLKDDAWQDMKDAVQPGRSGPNTGGLKADFHRVTIKLGHCESIAPGKSREIGVKYFLPLTGPANFTLKTGGTTYGLTQDRRRGTTTVEPPATGGGPACQAEAWDAARTYNPAWAPFALWRTQGGWKIQDPGSSLVVDHPGTWATTHLIGSQDGNANQVWNIVPDGSTGRFRIITASGGRQQCLGADGRLAEASVRSCDGGAAQSWSFTDERGAPVAGIPADGRPHGLLAASGHVLEPRNSGGTVRTKLVAGDPEGATRTVVSYGGFYWKAKFWTKGNRPDAADPKNAWSRLGPVA